MVKLCEPALISPYAARFLQGDHTGEVLLTTSRGVYLQFGGEILSLHSMEYGVTPIGIGAANYHRIAPLLEAGQRVRITGGRVFFPQGSMALVPQPLPPERAVPVPKQALVEACAVRLWEAGNPKGLAPLCRPLLLDGTVSSCQSPLCRAAYPTTSALLTALREADAPGVMAQTAKLTGLGIGLTPSGDDMLLGLLYALLRSPLRDRGQLLAEAVRESSGSTHAISAAYLLAVAEGAPFALLDDILRGLGGTQAPSIAPLLAIGSSSGSEMLLGVLAAAQMMK